MGLFDAIIANRHIASYFTVHVVKVLRYASGHKCAMILSKVYINHSEDICSIA